MIAPFFAVICQDLRVPDNGMVSYSDPNIPRAVGSTGSYNCNTGYIFSGTFTKTCTATGWTDSIDGTSECLGKILVCHWVKSVYMYVQLFVLNSLPLLMEGLLTILTP